MAKLIPLRHNKCELEMNSREDFRPAKLKQQSSNMDDINDRARKNVAPGTPSRSSRRLEKLPRLKGSFLPFLLLATNGAHEVSALRGGSVRALQGNLTETPTFSPTMTANCTVNSECDDNNTLTVDTCVSGECEHSCDDGNGCTNEGFVDGVCQYIDDCEGDYSDCEPGVMYCDDEDQETMDFCLPVGNDDFPEGCNYLNVIDQSVYGVVDKLQHLPNETYFFEDDATISEPAVLNLLKWIKQEVVQLRAPFCWRRARGRGLGRPVDACEDGKEKVGLSCYTTCSEYDTGEITYSRGGNLDCRQDCKDGWLDGGLFCRVPEYGRGAGYKWRIGDALDDTGMISRCEADHGAGECEKWGLVYFPKCREGYDSVGCCTCRASPTPDCEEEGYSSDTTHDALSCAVKIKSPDPTPLLCEPEEQEDAGLCYPRCQEGSDGVGPVCWQQCGENQVNCGAGCATSSEHCVFALFERSINPVVVAANMEVLDGARAGEYFRVFGDYAIDELESNEDTSDNLARMASVFKRIKATRDGTTFKKAKLLGAKVSSQFYALYNVGSREFANDFMEMTSQEISDRLDTELEGLDAFYVKMRWADIQFKEMQESQSWAFTDIISMAAGLVDITGVTDLVATYAKPQCAHNITFPSPADDESHLPPEASCQDITLNVGSSSNCLGDASAHEIGKLSSDDSGDDELKFFIDGDKDIKMFRLSGAPHIVELTVEDPFGLRDTCEATVHVVDTTPSTIACPQVQPHDNTQGMCGTTVLFEGPNVVNNCQSTSTTTQITGGPSGSFFDVGLTQITYQVEDSIGNIDTCDFSVTVIDVEKPTISCMALAAPVCDGGKGLNIFPADEGACTRVHLYTPPVGTDNCHADTYQLEGPSFGSPFVFPVGTTVNTFVAVDPSGNEATCSFNVTIEDRENPTLDCPPEAIRPCFETEPEEAGIAIATDNCENIQAPNLTYSDDTDDDIVGTACPGITMRTWSSTDWKGNRADECTQRLIEVEPDALTDLTNCVYEKDTFNIIFEPDQSRNPTHRISSTTPGYFVYHAFHVGDPGQNVTLSLRVPYPFITRGVYAWDWLDIEPGLNNKTCFLPKGNLFFQSDNQVVLSDYASGECGDSKEVLVQVLTPDTGFIHVAINLDFGLKEMSNTALGFWDQGSQSGNHSDRLLLGDDAPASDSKTYVGESNIFSADDQDDEIDMIVGEIIAELEADSDYGVYDEDSGLEDNNSFLDEEEHQLSPHKFMRNNKKSNIKPNKKSNIKPNNSKKSNIKPSNNKKKNVKPNKRKRPSRPSRSDRDQCHRNMSNKDRRVCERIERLYCSSSEDRHGQNRKICREFGFVDQCSFEFTISGNHAAGRRSLENINVYKKNSGVAGFVRNTFYNPLPGVSVSLYDGATEVGSSVTDQDGHYDIAYNAKEGGAVLAVMAKNTTKDVHLKSENSIGSADFTF